MGNAAFISHQWVGNVHPDPESKQLRVLQNALKHVLCGVGNIPFDIFTETFFPRAKPFPVSDLQAKPLHLWYDYMSCPQLERHHSRDVGRESSLARAIDSIPGYIARCKFFFALCPVVESESLGKVFTGLSWCGFHANYVLATCLASVEAGWASMWSLTAKVCQGLSFSSDALLDSMDLPAVQG